jgi:prefoldin subunit 5
VRATRNQIAILRDQLTGLQELVVADMLRQAVREQGTLTGRLNGIDSVIARLGEELAEALGAAEAFADLQAEAEAITQRLTGMQEVLASLQNQQEDDRRLLLLGPAELPTMPN